MGWPIPLDIDDSFSPMCGDQGTKLPSHTEVELIRAPLVDGATASQARSEQRRVSRRTAHQSRMTPDFGRKLEVATETGPPLGVIRGN
jgi:hypothetical protein